MASDQMSYLGEDQPTFEKTIPPIYYICLHRTKDSGCRLWKEHGNHRYPIYDPVDEDTVCPDCGHADTLVPVN